MRNVLIEAKPGKPAPSQMHTQLLDQLAFTRDAVQVADQQDALEEFRIDRRVCRSRCRNLSVFRVRRRSCWVDRWKSSRGAGLRNSINSPQPSTQILEASHRLRRRIQGSQGGPPARKGCDPRARRLPRLVWTVNRSAFLETPSRGGLPGSAVGAIRVLATRAKKWRGFLRSSAQANLIGGECAAQMDGR
jgi:hypothetical protein